MCLLQDVVKILMKSVAHGVVELYNHLVRYIMKSTVLWICAKMWYIIVVVHSCCIGTMKLSMYVLYVQWVVQ